MLALKIAMRYLVARKSHNAVNIIAIVAVAGITVATAAMIVVLSVFNGFSDLAAMHISRIDAPLQITRADGRVIASADTVVAIAQSIAGVSAAVPVIEDRALAVSQSGQKAVVFKGLPDNYRQVVPEIDSIVIDGIMAGITDVGQPAAQLSVGVSNALLVRPDPLLPLHLYVPRRTGRINPANPDAAFRGSNVAVSAIYRVGQPDIDENNILIPLCVARDLMMYETEATAVDVGVKKDADTDEIKKSLSRKLTDEYRVRDRMEQRSEAFQMISIEKWVTFMMLVFVLLIALFNIVSTLSLLIIEKRDDMRTLRALGGTRRLVRNIFTCEAWLITTAGGLLGTVVGIALSLAQQYGKFIRLNGDPGMLTVAEYPVRVAAADLVAVLAAVALTGLITAAIVRLLAPKK